MEIAHPRKPISHKSFQNPPKTPTRLEGLHEVVPDLAMVPRLVINSFFDIPIPVGGPQKTQHSKRETGVPHHRPTGHKKPTKSRPLHMYDFHFSWGGIFLVFGIAGFVSWLWRLFERNKIFDIFRFLNLLLNNCKGPIWLRQSGLFGSFQEFEPGKRTAFHWKSGRHPKPIFLRKYLTTLIPTSKFKNWFFFYLRVEKVWLRNLEISANSVCKKSFWKGSNLLPTIFLPFLSNFS